MKDKQKQVVDATLKGIDIPVIDGKVNGRALHSELKVGRDFTNWVKGRIEEYGFEEGVDFTTYWSDAKTGVAVEFSGNVNQMTGKGYSINYSITLGMAKELAMLEKNEVGRRIRKYFIKCEENLIEAVKQGMVPEEMLLEAKA